MGTLRLPPTTDPGGASRGGGGQGPFFERDEDRKDPIGQDVSFGPKVIASAAIGLDSDQT